MIIRTLTPYIHAMSNRKVVPPTGILGLMELMRPGRSGGTAMSIASTARQFCTEKC